MRLRALTLGDQHRHSILLFPQLETSADAKSEVVHENDKGSSPTALLLRSESQENQQSDRMFARGCR